MGKYCGKNVTIPDGSPLAARLQLLFALQVAVNFHWRQILHAPDVLGMPPKQINFVTIFVQTFGHCLGYVMYQYLVYNRVGPLWNFRVTGLIKKTPVKLRGFVI